MNLKHQGISFIIRGMAFTGLGVYIAFMELMLSGLSQPSWKALISFPLVVYGLVRLMQGIKRLKAYKKLQAEQSALKEE